MPSNEFRLPPAEVKRAAEAAEVTEDGGGEADLKAVGGELQAGRRGEPWI